MQTKGSAVQRAVEDATQAFATHNVPTACVEGALTVALCHLAVDPHCPVPKSLGAIAADLGGAAANDPAFGLPSLRELLVYRRRNLILVSRILAEEKAVWELKHPETRHGGSRKGGPRPSRQMPFSKMIAADCGVSVRTIDRMVSLAAIDAEAARLLEWHPEAYNARALAVLVGLPSDRKRGVADAPTRAAPLAMTIAAALKIRNWRPRVME